MGLYYNGHKVRNLYYNGKCITRLALGKELTRLVEGDDFVCAEWLVGDGNAAIRTTELFASTDSIETHIDITGFPTQKWSYIYGNDAADYDYTLMAVLFPNGGLHFRPQREAITSAIQEYTIIHNLNGVYVNGVKVINTQKEFVATTNPISVFTSNNFDSQSIKFSGRISYFNIPNKLALTPCRLLRPIPAALDGNGIARQAGECGMWDKVSNKFYGNMASSGTFTVEPSLVEGVDYERHKYLVGDGSAYIDTLINKLEGTITVDIDRTSVTSNSNIFGREAYPGLGYESRCVVNLLRQNNNYIADIYGIRTTSGYGVNIDMMDTLYLDLVTKIASTKSGNSTSIDIGTDIGGYNMLLFAKNSGSAPSYCWSGSIGSFKMADVISLTPVRLLRPLPSYLDANGKARHQFECGMLDLKTMKFYGNVNTTGTFTVSDN